MSDKDSQEPRHFQLDPVWDLNLPQPDCILEKSPSQNVPWAQWMDEIEDWCRIYHKPRKDKFIPERFVMD